MNTLRLLALTGLLVLTAPLHAAALKSESEAEALAERVMQSIGKNDLDTAYGLIKQYSVLPAADLDNGLQASKAQRNAQFRQRYGDSVGYERISKKSLGKSMMRLVYIEKTQKHPLPWAFFFYQTPSGWALTQVGWDDQAAALYAAE
jgi:hypothetical protein